MMSSLRCACLAARGLDQKSSSSIMVKGDSSEESLGMSAGESSEPLKSSERLSLGILALVKANQQSNGLRHRDYQRYRQYCTRRLRRIRCNKGLKGVKCASSPSAKYDGMELTAAMCLEGGDDRYLQLVLVSAERAWSYAMQLKDENNREGEDARKRLHLVRRLAKAAKWSAQLQQLCADAADDQTSLEAEAYCAWMQGNLWLEKDGWKLAYEGLDKAKAIYSQLSSVVSADLRDLMAERVVEIENTLRYCSYNVSLEEGTSSKEALLQLQKAAGSSDLLHSKINKVLEEGRKTQAEQAVAIQWKGKAVTVRSAAVRLKLLEAREKLADVEAAAANKPVEDETEEIVFLETLSVLDDVARAAREAKASLVKSGIDADKAAQECTDIVDYVKAQKLLLTVRHSMLHTRDTAHTPTEMVIVFDRALHNVREVIDLIDARDARDDQPDQPAADPAALDAVRPGEVLAQEQICMAYRALYIATTLSAEARWSEAYALLEHNVERIVAAKAMEIASDQQQGALQHVHDETRAARCLVLARSFKARLHHADDDTANDSALTEVPPPLAPVPCHPIVFDLAYTELRYGELPATGSANAKTKTKTKTNAMAKAQQGSNSEDVQAAQDQGQDQEGGAGWLSSARGWLGRK